MTLKDWRKKNNWTQLDLAVKVGVCETTVHRWEKGINPSRLARRELEALGFKP